VNPVPIGRSGAFTGHAVGTPNSLPDAVVDERAEPAGIIAPSGSGRFFLVGGAVSLYSR
jgi:hypothetical protein